MPDNTTSSDHATTGAPRDLRPVLFSGAKWYDQLAEPRLYERSVWYLVKAPLARTALSARVLNAAAQFVVDHDLVEHYRVRFAGIPGHHLTPERADAEAREITAPIDAIANEFAVGHYLERVLGWTYLAHAPLGRDGKHGEWLFRSASGREVFVEVKSMSTPDAEPTDDHIHSRPDYRPRIRNVLKDAYKQLPERDQATLVVIASDEIARIDFNIMLGDLFQTLFGQFQVRFNPFAEDPNYRAGPSFRDRFAHGTKHRELGCVAGFAKSGLWLPEVRLHAIDNPYAHSARRLTDGDLANTHRMTVDADWQGDERDGLPPEEVWARFAGAMTGA